MPDSFQVVVLVLLNSLVRLVENNVLVGFFVQLTVYLGLHELLVGFTDLRVVDEHEVVHVWIHHFVDAEVPSWYLSGSKRQLIPREVLEHQI